MTATEPRYLIDTYLDFIAAEGLPVVESFGIDLLGVETKPWARMGPVNGSYVHTSGRGDFLNMYVLDLPPARATDRGGALEPGRLGVSGRDPGGGRAGPARDGVRRNGQPPPAHRPRAGGRGAQGE